MSLLTHKKALLLAAVLLALPFLAARVRIGGNAVNVVRETNVSLNSFSITLSPSLINAGNVTFHIQNDSPDFRHEFHILRTSLAANQLPVISNGDVDENKLDKITDLRVLKPGEMADLSINLTAGHYVLMCNIAGHYPAGMHADLTVVP